MPDQPELRQRLAETLQRHRSISGHLGVFCTCDEWKWSPQHVWYDHLADVLLALPGIAITPLPHANKDGCWSISGRNDLSVENGEVHQVLPKSSGMAVACRSPELVRKIAAALLAAAGVAEEQTNA